MGNPVRKTLIGALAAGAIALAYMNWHLATTSVDVSPLAVSVPATSEADALKEEELAPLAPLTSKDRLAETLERPLFNATRRPDPEVPETPDLAAPASDATAFGNLKLVGLMQWGANQRALIRVSGEPYARWVELGGDVNGWKLRAIENNSVVVEQDDRRHEIKLVARPDRSQTQQE